MGIINLNTAQLHTVTVCWNKIFIEEPLSPSIRQTSVSAISKLTTNASLWLGLSLLKSWLLKEITCSEILSNNRCRLKLWVRVVANSGPHDQINYIILKFVPRYHSVVAECINSYFPSLLDLIWKTLAISSPLWYDHGLHGTSNIWSVFVFLVGPASA